MLRSALPPGWRHLIHVLCTHVDEDAGVILPQFQPSLTKLASETGLHRRTIMRHLNGLERHGWVGRLRPSPADARTKHARTQYSVNIGRNPPPQAGDASSPELGTEGPVAGGTAPSELGAGNPVSRGGMPLRSSMSSKSSGGVEIEAVIEAIREKTGSTVTAEWAARVAEQVLGAREDIRDRVAYLRTVIRAAPADTYRQTPQPPRFTKAKGFEQ